MAKPIGALVDGRYQVLRFLGQGSFGEVYEVRDLHQNMNVALKLLGPRQFGGPWQEAQVLTHLQSDYILPVLNADFDAGVPYLVTTLARHGSADARMTPRGVEPRTAVRWIRSACRGAARTHDARLLHRDIKPENLFLTADDEALLGDFGISCLMDASGHCPAGGTAQTMAPEVAAGGSTSIASDVYSLGASLYALLAGQYAHDHPDGHECMRLVASQTPTPLRDVAPHVSQALAQRVSKAMARDPSDRYQSAQEFDSALGQLPSPSRNWCRSDEHISHSACWRGEADGKQDVTVCLVPSGTRLEVIAEHQPSGRRILAACRPAAPPSALPRNVRAAIGSVD
jgi:eukaryotic-like serine/threonine-protein kinase